MKLTVALFTLLAAACTAAQDPGITPPAGDTPSATDPADPPVTTPPGSPGDSKDSGTVEPKKDTTAPVVVLTATPSTITAAGNIRLSVVVNDASALSSLVVYSSGAALSTITAAPYTVTHAVTQADNGTYVFTAEATDAAGNVGKSAPVTVKVDIAGAPQVPTVPAFVAAGTANLITGATSLAVPTPAAIQANDFLIAMIDAQEESGARTLAVPAGWTLVGGFPVHNVSTAHPPYIIPASESHGTWIFHKFAAAGEPAATTFDFASAATARGVMVSYRGVDTTTPIQGKSALGFHGTGGTNGLGSGNTPLQRGRQVNLIATALTSNATYTVVQTSGSSIVERFNSGEQPNGLNLIVHDSTTSFGIFTGPSIANRQSPSGSSDAFLFTATTLVLKPQ
jgi:hypothetical protein